MRYSKTLLILAIALVGTPRPAPAQSTGASPRDSIASRLADLRRIHTPEGIEVLEPVEVNGSTQWLSIRGLNRANPILLVLHGGPGSPVMGSSWAYQKPWEDFFTVVNWDRRGVGKSFSAADSARLGPTMTLQQLVDDAAVIVEHLLARLGQEKLVVLGYSYGTRIGPRLVERHPERFHAYVGLGQAGGPDAERQLYETLMARVREANDTTAIRELEALQPYPPSAGPGAVDKLLAARRWAREYDGGWYGKPTFDLYFALPEWGPEYTATEVANLQPAMAWAERHLIDRAPEPRPTRLVERFEVPVVILHGRFDLHTPYESARDYFDRIEAPHKRFVTFERGSHMIMFEEPGRLLLTLVEEVLPLAGGSASF
ncbi:alpha/beta fold hydrolase [Candidatus Palauibacter sp.]|uniref:alpha/beta fold hydrolase n=1 Tax=Candidatus Palauibacter sp. TaxID=3101350 RepID=UPI003B0192F0